MKRHAMFRFTAALLAPLAASGADAGGSLPSIRRDVLSYIESLRVPGKPLGHYFDRPGPSGKPSLYASCDAVHLRTVMGEDLQKSLTAAQRAAWIGHINSFARPDGTYAPARANHSAHHANGMVIGALGALGGTQKYPVQLYAAFDAADEARAWLETLDWRRQWGGSHLFWGGMHCFSLSRRCNDAWRHAVFDWLDANLDPRSGWWRQGVAHAGPLEPLGGGAHIWPVYQHHGRRFPFPERVIDSILALQKPDGAWLNYGNYMELDALYGLAYMATQAPGHRRPDILEAARRHGRGLAEQWPAFLARKPDLHVLLGAVGAFGLLQQLLPDAYPDATAWTDIFSDKRLYQTRRVESTPNILLILTDDQGYGDFSCHGNPVLRTPHLDQLHHESVRFTDFHAAPMCTPTRGQLLTGRDALANGASCVCSGRTFVRREVPAMAGLFADAGYRTALFGKWHLGDNYPHRPNDRAFQEAVYHGGWGITSTPDRWDNDYFDDFFRHNGRLQQYPGYCTDVFFTAAERWMQSCAAAGRPFLCYLSLNAPHGPFYVAEKYREPYRHLGADVSGFFGMIANLDENMGRIEAMLRKSGLRDNTIVVFMTDNGGTGGIPVFTAGMRGAKASLYEGGHRVPCFLRWPAGHLRAPGDLRALTQVQDVLPTLLDLCGLSALPPGPFGGVSLAPLLRGMPQPGLADRTLFVQYSGLTRSDPEKWDAAVLHRNWRLVHGRELYDIQADPGQATDVAARHPDLVQAMRARYEAWWSALQPELRKVETVDIGSERENPVCLTAMDWHAPSLTPASQPFDIRLLGQTVVNEGSLPGGRPQPVMNGAWNLRIARAGSYRVSLRRWPREAGAAITAGLPAYQAVAGSFPEGKALPIASARLQIGEQVLTKPVNNSDQEIVFETNLKTGKAQLQTCFYDAQGRELCGAFYVELLRQ